MLGNVHDAQRAHVYVGARARRRTVAVKQVYVSERASALAGDFTRDDFCEWDFMLCVGEWFDLDAIRKTHGVRAQKKNNACVCYLPLYLYTIYKYEPPERACAVRSVHVIFFCAVFCATHKTCK